MKALFRRLKLEPKLHRASKAQRGQGLVEYLILVAVLAIGTMAAVRLVGHSLNVKFATVARSLGARVEGSLETPSAKSSSFRKKDLSDFMTGSTSRGSKAGDQDEGDAQD